MAIDRNADEAINVPHIFSHILPVYYSPRGQEVKKQQKEFYLYFNICLDRVMKCTILLNLDSEYEFGLLNILSKEEFHGPG